MERKHEEPQPILSLLSPGVSPTHHVSSIQTWEDFEFGLAGCP